MAEFLLEIGCEEIPAGWLGALTLELREGFLALAAAEQLPAREAESHSTPRRLVLRAELPARQADREEPVFGPSLRAARDAAGAWTGAALGFARKCGVAPEQLGSGERPGKPGDPVLVFVRRSQGLPAREVLPRLIAATLRSLSFPKRMNWDAWLDDGKGAFPFGRPIRWMVALLDGAVVPFTVHELAAGERGRPLLESGAVSRGHRFFPRGKGGEPVQVASFRELAEKLRERFVLLSREERTGAIREGLAGVAGQIRDGHGLGELWASLVEHPAVVVGEVPPEFRGLPREVLETVLVHHQKYLPLLPDGRTVERFAAVTDGDGAGAERIVRGMERVVVARLRDARFFYEEDLKRPLTERVADLAGVTFHQKLGSYLDKAERLVRLVDAMAAQLGVLTRPQREAAREAARLAKADLTTAMVREFPELQGVMGGIYLRAQGSEWPSVAAAVHWHYHPLSIEPEAPPFGALLGEEAAVFAAVSVADKLDTLAGYFGLGLQPGGGGDPYGLRRAGQGVVRVLLDFWSSAAAERRPGLRGLVAAALAGYGSALPRPAAETARELEAFLLERLRHVLAARGYPGDEVEAALGAREPDALDDPREALERLRALHKIRSEVPDDFRQLATAFKRAKNILGAAAPGAVDAALLREAAERELFQAVGRLQGQDGAHEARLRALAGLRAPVDRFFDDVLVMAEDERVRANRLSLLASTLQLFYRIADISRLGG